MSKKRIEERRNILTIQREKQRRRYFLGCIVTILLMVFGVRAAIMTVEDQMSHVTQDHAEKDIIETSGYEVHGNHYKLMNDEPEIIISSKIKNINAVKITFGKKLDQNVKGFVYFLGGNSQGSDDAVEKIICKNSDSIYFPIPSGEYGAIKLVILGDFSLEEVCLSGYSVARLSAATIGLIFMIILLLVIFAIFCFWKENRVYAFACKVYERMYGVIQRKELGKEGVAFIILGAIILSLMIIGENNWLEDVKEEISNVQQESRSQDAVAFQGYSKKGDVYTKVGDDPQLVFKNTMPSVSHVEILFREPLKEDMLVQVFYCKEGEGWSEESSRKEYALAGNDNISFDIPEKTYDKMRLDLDGNFMLDCVKFSAREDKSVSIWNYMVLLLIDGAFVCLWGISLVKKNIVYVIIVGIGDYIKKWYIIANRKVFSLGRKRGIRLEKVFLVLALMLGVTYSVLIPPGHVPDEPSHAEDMLDAFGYGGKMNTEIVEYLDKILFYKAAFNPQVKQDQAVMKSEMGRRFSPEAREFEHLPTFKIVRYLPAGIGYVICVSLNLPIYYCLQVAEIFSVIFYAVVGYFAIKRLKIMRGALFTVMILPMTLQQCASLNYDVVLLTGCFWTFSYFVHCITDQEKVGWKDVLILLLCCVVIASIKPPYLFLFLLFFAIPKEKVILPMRTKENIYPFICKYWHVFFCALFLGVICLVIANSGYYGNLIKSVFIDFDHTLDVFLGTYHTHKDFYSTSTVGNFGWLIYPMPYSFEMMSYGIMVVVALCSTGYASKNGMAARIWSVIAVMASVLFIFLAMISWTFMLEKIDAGTTVESFREAYAKIGAITGVQGRYFIPLIPFLMYAAHDVIRVNKKNHVIAMILIYGIWIVWPIASISRMFWG